MLRRDTDGGSNLVCCRREANRGGLADLDPGIAPVQRELEWFGTDAIGTEGGPEVIEERAVLFETVRFDLASLTTDTMRDVRTCREYARRASTTTR